MATLDKLLLEFPFLSIVQLSEKLKEVLASCLNTEDKLVVLRLLTACKQWETVQNVMTCGSDFADSLKNKPQYFPIGLRLDIERSAAPTFQPTDVPASAPRWAKKYAVLGTEMIYPLELRSIRVATKNSLVLSVLNFICPACGGTLTTTATAHWLPLDAEKDTVLCFHCLAKLQWQKSTVRTRIFEYYDSLMASFPRTEDGLLCAEDVKSAAVLAVALRPFALIRFVKVFSERIGHFVAEVFIYLRRRMAGLEEPSQDYLCLGSGEIANAYLGELWNRILQFEPCAEQMYDILRGTEHAYWMYRAALDSDDGVHRFQISLPFTVREHDKGLQQLEQMGIPRGSRIVCLLVRDAAYMQKLYPGHDTNNIRNISVDIFHKAAKFLTSKGFYVLRMGAITEQPLTWVDDMIIDYASHHRSEFMDLWLFSYCDLVLTTSTGIDSLRVMQGTNYLGVNFFPLPQFPLSAESHSVLFPHYVWTKTQKRLTLQETIELDKNSFAKSRNYTSQGVSLQNCNEEEVLAAVEEKILLMQGGRLGEEDMALQWGFKNFFKKNKSLFSMPGITPNVGNISTYREPLRGSVSSVWARQYAEELLSYL